MRRLSSALLVVGFFVLLLTPTTEAFAGGGKGSSGGPVHVDGSFRKDGTYVQPHVRSAHDGSPYNNYGFPGNYNPNKGQITPGDPNKYLERYYEKKSSPWLPRTGTDD